MSDEAVLVGYILSHMNTFQSILEYSDTENTENCQISMLNSDAMQIPWEANA